jgi:exopolysaccharide biosynthesis polyprenyl glycosylphosphotransferase
VQTENLEGLSGTARGAPSQDGETAALHMRSRHDRRVYNLRRLLLLADVLAFAAGFSASELYDVATGRGVEFGAVEAVRLAAGLPLWLLLTHAFSLYHTESRRADHGVADEIGPILQMATLWTWTMALAATIVDSSRHLDIPELAVFWATGIVSMVAFRAVARAWSRRRPWYVENAIVVGTPSRAAATVRKLRRHPEFGIEIVACVDPDATSQATAEESTPDGLFGEVRIIRGEEGLYGLLSDLDVNRVIVASWPEGTGERYELLDRLAEFDVPVDLVPGWFELLGLKLELYHMEGTPLLRVPSRQLGRSSLIVKRGFDVTVSAGVLLLASPLIAACAVAIWLEDRGPVLFRQRRVGKEGQRFELLKFRSMKVDADHQKDRVATLNYHGGGRDEGMFKIRRDPRVTRVGYWLRRSSLDELPQLVNVLRGDMSLVGARPLIEEEDCQIEGRFRRRNVLTPGITGLWQVHGRSDIPFETMLHLDYLYASSWSIWGDVKILVRTVSAVSKRRGAY